MSGEWIVLLEASDPHGNSPITRDALERLLAEFPSHQAAALFNPHRYALHLTLAADDPAGALASALDRWRRAVGNLDLPRWTVCRTEVMTGEEFDHDLRVADIRERNEALPGGRGAEELLREVFLDPVTGLPSPELFCERVRLVLEDEGASGQPAVILVLDIDSFTDANRLVGHAGGDHLLALTARRLEQAHPAVRAIVRLEADRFAVLACRTGTTDIGRVAEALLREARQPVEAGGTTVQLTASIGIASADGRTEPQALLREASAAMLAAKNAGGDRFTSFDETSQRFLNPLERAYGSPLDRLSHVLLLQRAAMEANSRDEVNEAFQVVIHNVCAHTGWPIGRLYPADGNGEHVAPSGVHHIVGVDRYIAFNAAVDKYASGRTGLAARVMATGLPAWTLRPEIDYGAAIGAAAAEAGLHSAVAFPVLVGDEVVGVLEFFRNEGLPPDGSLIEVMISIGAQLGRVVERSRARVASARSELRYRALAESASDAIMSLDDRCEIVSWNRAAARIFGYHDDEVIGRPIAMLMADGRASPAYDDLYAMAKEGSAGSNREVMHRRADGTVFLAEASVSAWEVDGRQYFTVISRDQTARLRAESELRARDARFRALIENSTDSIVLIDTGGEVLGHYSSQDFLGYSVAENAGRIGFEFIHPEDQPAAVQSFLALLEQPGVSPPYELRVRDAGGEWRWVESVGNNLLGHPDVAAVVITSRDVTDRHRAQETLLRNEARRLLILRALGEDLVVVDAAGAVVDCLGGPHLAGTTPQTLGDFIHPDDLDRFLAAVVDCAAERDGNTGPVPGRLSFGGETVALSWVLVNLSDDELVGGVVLHGRRSWPA